MWLCVSLLSGATFDYKNLNCLEINLSNQTLETEERIRLREKQRHHKENIQAQLDTDHIPPSERTCFMCKCNLAWRNRPDVDIAHCGPYMRMGVPENTPPDTAKTCRGFVPKG